MVIADKGYDANYLRDSIINPVIPCISRRKRQIPYNKELYKARNVVERFFLKLKYYRKVATRYEQTALNFLSLIFVCSRYYKL
jgi:transposase